MAEKIDLRPQVVDLYLYSGDGIRFRLVVTDNDDAPVNITGTVKAQIRTRRGTDGTPEADFDVDLTDHASGIVSLTLPGSAIYDLAPSRKYSGFWDVEWTPSGDEPRSLCQGAVEVDLDVSR